jgi:sugar lactone lactonase YvrE
MTFPVFRSFLSDGLLFPESPRWHDGELWFSDLLAGRLMKAGLDGSVSQIAKAEGWLSGLGWLPNGDLIAVGMESQRLLRLDQGRLVEVCDLSRVTTMHPNDMVVDAQGRAYIGEVGYDLHGGEAFKGANLVMVAPGLEPKVVADNLACPNGMVITADGRTLIVAETLGDCLTAFDIREDGGLANRRTWASTPGLGPDGICLDVEGAIWAGCPFSGTVIRVKEGGEITNRFATEKLPLACMLGGADRKQMFLCRAEHPDQVQVNPEGGCIDIVDVEIAGTGLP